MAAEVSPSSTGLLLGVGVTFCGLSQGPATSLTMNSPSHGSHSSQDKIWEHPSTDAQTPSRTDPNEAFAASPTAETFALRQDESGAAQERGLETTPASSPEGAADGDGQSVCDVLRWGQKKRLRYVRSQGQATSSPPLHSSAVAVAAVTSIVASMGVHHAPSSLKDEKKEKKDGLKDGLKAEPREVAERMGEDARRLLKNPRRGGDPIAMEGSGAMTDRWDDEAPADLFGNKSTALVGKALEFTDPCKARRACTRTPEPCLPGLAIRGAGEAQGRRGTRAHHEQQRLDDADDAEADADADADADSSRAGADPDADAHADVSGAAADEDEGYAVDMGEGAFSDDSCPARGHSRRKRHHGPFQNTQEHKIRDREKGKERMKGRHGKESRKAGNKLRDVIHEEERQWEDHSSCRLIQSYGELSSTPHPSVASLIFSGHCPLSAASAASVAAAAAAAAALPSAAEAAFVIPKFLISLSRLEKEEDFWAIRGGRLPLRPKKRSKAVEKGVQRLQPGSWLTGVSCERYQVRERKSKKKARGLRGMSGRGSDTE